MNQLYLTFFYFFLVIFGFFLNTQRLKLGKAYSFIYFLCLFFLALIIVPDISFLSRDFNNYYNWFLKIEKEGLDNFLTLKDPVFQYIVYIIQKIFGNNYIYIYIIIFLAISYLKFSFTNKMNLGKYYLILLWIIFGQTFILYEITQIRAGLAISLCSLFIARDINKKENINILLMLISCFIHQSVSILFLSYLVLIFCSKKVLSRFNILAIYFLGIFFGLFLKTNIYGLISLNFTNNDRAKDYLDNTYTEIFEVSFFSLIFIVESITIFLLCFYYRFLDEGQKKVLFLSVLSCFFYSAFSFNSVFAYRFSEIYIFFSLTSIVYIIMIKEININLRYIWFVCLIVLGFVFSYSSSNILLGS